MQAAVIQNIVNGQPVKCQPLIASNSNSVVNTNLQGLTHTGIGNSAKQPFLSAQSELAIVDARSSPSNLLLKNETTKDAPTLLGSRKEKKSSSKGEIAVYYSNCAKDYKNADDQKNSQRAINNTT